MGLIINGLCVMQRFWVLCMDEKELMKCFEQAGSIQICELELFGSCGSGRWRLTPTSYCSVFRKCVPFPVASICSPYYFPLF